MGTAYIALMNYSFAKKNGGEFVLRIEDTDRQRSSLASEQIILDSLRWLGLHWNEGPDVGGPHGPYRQSDRTSIYQAHCDHLLAEEHAFKCFCSAQTLNAMREEQRRRGERPQYDGRCQRLSPADVAARELAGDPFVVRMKVPKQGVCVVRDLIRGPIEIEWQTVDQQILLKSDGMPTYHLANVVDDHLMEITHVLRGEEWIASAPKHVLLYKYFGWEAPQLCHLPLLRNPDRSKLSKRKNPTGILFYKRMGYLPEALLNFLSLFAISVAEGDEKMPLDALIGQFDIGNISLGGPVFDLDKLKWLNSRYIRETLSPEQFIERVTEWGFERERLLAIARLAQNRVERLSDLGPLTAFMFSGALDLTASRLRDNKVSELTQRQAYQFAMWEFDKLPAWDLPGVEKVLRMIAEKLQIKFRDAVRPFYLAITGSPQSLPLFDSMVLLGRDICRERLRLALQAIGPVSAREAEAWKKQFVVSEEAGEDESAAD